MTKPVLCLGHRTRTMHRALLLPEILAGIFVHIVDADSQGSRANARTLFALSVVNRMFSEHALDLLWARGDSLALVSLIPPEWCPLEQEVSPYHIIRQSLLLHEHTTVDGKRVSDRAPPLLAILPLLQTRADSDMAASESFHDRSLFTYSPRRTQTDHEMGLP
jgi:hypothetical protein